MLNHTKKQQIDVKIKALIFQNLKVNLNVKKVEHVFNAKGVKNQANFGSIK